MGNPSEGWPWWIRCWFLLRSCMGNRRSTRNVKIIYEGATNKSQTTSWETIHEKKLAKIGEWLRLCCDYPVIQLPKDSRFTTCLNVWMRMSGMKHFHTDTALEWKDVFPMCYQRYKSITKPGMTDKLEAKVLIVIFEGPFSGFAPSIRPVFRSPHEGSRTWLSRC